MPQLHQEPILNQSFCDLNFSRDFISIAKANQLCTPVDMLQVSVFHLESFPGFSQKMLFEFVRFLERQKLADYLNEFS